MDNIPFQFSFEPDGIEQFSVTVFFLTECHATKSETPLPTTPEKFHHATS